MNDNRITRLLCVLLWLWIVCGIAAAQPQAAPPFTLPEQAEAGALALALTDAVRNTDAAPPLPDVQATEVWAALTVMTAGAPADVVWATAADAQAVMEAWTRILPTIPDTAGVRVDVAYGPVRERLAAPEFRTSRSGDAWGLAFDPITFGIALPAEIEARQLFDADGIMDRERWVDYATERGFDADGLAEALTFSPLNVYRFQTVTAVQRPGEPAALLKSSRLYAESLTPAILRDSARAAGDYLARSVRPDGQFDYLYDAGTGDLSQDYNMLRHAGTMYAMIELERESPDPVRRAAIGRALRYALAHVGPCVAPVSRAEAACLIEDDEIKLGGQGLLLLALTEFAEVTGDAQYMPEMRALAEWIAGAQSADGTFVHIVDARSGQVRDFESSYYPGEAAFGLLRLYLLDPDPRWLETAQRAVGAIIAANADTADDDLPHDHWLLYALSVLHEIDPDAVDRDYVRRLAWVITQAQHRVRVPDSWIGGYFSPPASTPTAIRSEGLCAVLPILAGEDALIAADVRDVVLAGVAFQLQTQITADDTIYLADPARALGGFADELYGYDIRIDTVQHNLSALLCAVNALAGE